MAFGLRFFIFQGMKGGWTLTRRTNLWFSLLSAVSAALLIYAVYLLQVRQIRNQEMTDVVAPKQFIQSGTLVTAEMLEYVSIAKSERKEEMITDVDEAVGLEAAVPLGIGEPLLGWKLSGLHSLPNGGQSTFQIPKEYIRSISSGIRA